MNDQVSTTPEPTLMNDDAARSQTGEILDQSATQTATTSEQTKLDASTTSETSPKTETKPSTEGEKKPDAAQGAPEAYTDFTLPEGLTLAPETLTEAQAMFKELNLSQEQAQRLVSFQAKQMQSLSRDPIEAIKSQTATWSAETLADPDISAYALDGKTGIDAVKLDIGRAKSVLSAEERSAFDRVMNWTGIGSNPAFVKALWRIGQHITEGRPVATAQAKPSPEGQRAPGTSARPSPAASLYPNLAR